MDLYLKYTGMTKAKVMEEMRPQAERQVKATLALEAVAKAEKFKITEKEIEAEYARVAESYQIDAEKAKEYVPEDVIRKDLSSRKAVELIKASAKITDAPEEAKAAKAEKEAKAAKEDAVLAKAVENATMEIPDPMIESQAEDMVNEFGERLQMQGMQLEQYLKYTGMSMKQIVDQYKDQAKKRIEGRLVLEAIVKAEGIEATEEDVEEGLKKLADDYKMDIEKVRGFFDDESMVNYKKDLATQKALDLLVAESK